MMRVGHCAAARSALKTSARSFCHSRNWVARSFGVFAFRIGRRRCKFIFPSRMKSRQAEYDRLAFYDDYWLPAVWRSLLRIGLARLLVPNTEFKTNTSRTIQHPAVNREAISLRRRVIILVATSKPSVGGVAAGRSAAIADQECSIGQNPHDWDDNRISLAARNETHALRLTAALRVNSGTLATNGL
jgi:hypothetical protein